MVEKYYAPLAQLVEQLPLKQMVAGSSPARRTNHLVIGDFLFVKNILIAYDYFRKQNTMSEIIAKTIVTKSKLPGVDCGLMVKTVGLKIPLYGII